MTRNTAAALQRLLLDRAVFKIWNYSAAAAFDEIWKLDEISENQHAIVVWADTPADPRVMPVATERYLTPFDWALAARCRKPGLRVTIVDLRPTVHDSGGYAALQWYRTHKPECIPWLRRVGVAELVDAPSSDSVRDLLGVARTEPASTDGEDQASRPNPGSSAPNIEPLSALRSLPVCQVDLDQTATHHSIANLIGPLLLLQRTPEPDVRAGDADHEHVANHRLALRQLLVAAGLLPGPALSPDEDFEERRKTVSPASGPARIPADDEDFVERRKRALANIRGARLPTLRLVLCDDQWHHGWLEWLCERTGTKPDLHFTRNVPAGGPEQPTLAAMADAVEVWVASGPGWLLEQLKNLAAQGSVSPLRRRVFLTDDALTGEDRSEILLLDLRLFAGDAKGLRETAERLRELFKVFEGNSAQQPIDTTATEPGIATEATPELLTFLPRALAIADPLLPILLFSSTGRQDVVRSLSGYPNIVGSFSKPRLFGDEGLDQRPKVEEAFDRALGDAARLLRRRHVVDALQAASDRVQRATTSGGFGPIITGGIKRGYVGIYVDESGQVKLSKDESGRVKLSKQPFVMAAVVALYKDRGAAEAFRAELKKRLPRQWTKAAHASPDERVRMASSIREAAVLHGVELRSAVIRRGHPFPDGPWYGESPIWANIALDRLHRVLLGQVIATALTYVVNDLEISADAECAVLTDVRTVPVNQLRIAALELLKFGIGIIDGENKHVSRGRIETRGTEADWKWTFLDTSGVLPIVEEVFSQDKRLRQKFRIDEARACKGLFDGGHPLVEWADYLANAVLRAHTKGFDSERLEDWAVELLKPPSVLSSYDVHVERLLRLAREVAHDVTAASVRELVEEPDRCVDKSPSSLADRCRAYIADVLEREYSERDSLRGARDASAKPLPKQDKAPDLDASRRTLYVGNASPRMKAADFGSLFEPFGEVVRVVIPTNPVDGRSRGFGFVEMKDGELAKAAKEALHHSTWDGRLINVAFFQPRGRRTSHVRRQRSQ